MIELINKRLLRTHFTTFILFFYSLSFGAEFIAIPNAQILGANAGSGCQIVPTNSTIKVFPKEIRTIILDGSIDEIQAFYGENVTFDQIASAIDARYPQYELVNLREKSFRLWRVLPRKFVVQLSIHEKSSVLIFTRMKKSMETP